jgi:signal transduction histidine kinase
MDSSLGRHEAVRVFRLLLVVQLVFSGLVFVVMLGYTGSVRLGLVLRAGPALILALLFLPPWLERVLGRYFLAVGLSLQVLFSSLEMGLLFGEQALARLAAVGLTHEVARQLATAPAVEPFFFVLIPLVLMAWGYGRRGALLGSTWAVGLTFLTGLWFLPRDDYLPAFLAQALARSALLYLVPLIISLLAQRERRQLAELEAAHERLRRHAATVEQLTVSRERNRLARDLHDTLAHSLAGLNVQLEALRTLLAHDPLAAQTAVDQITEEARQGLAESRKAIQALRTDPVETMGLLGALRDMLQAFEARTGVQARLHIAGEEEPRIALEEAQVLFRIADEAITNVERHASAQTVDVRLACGSNRVDLVIRDDGIGFDPAGARPDHYGLTGMLERAELIGATLELSSAPGGGTEVWCTLPR